MDIIPLIILSLIGEAVWETSKMFWQGGKLNIDRVGALIVALLLTFGTGIDLMEIARVPIKKIPFVGMFLTGLLISRGANFIHDFFGNIGSSYARRK